MNTLLQIGSVDFMLVTDDVFPNYPNAAGAVIKVNDQTGRYSGRGVINVLEEITRLRSMPLDGYKLYYFTVTGKSNPNHILSQVMMADPERIEDPIKRAGMRDMVRLFKPNITRTRGS